MEKRKKGRLEKKYWEQMIAMFPQLRDMVSKYETRFSVVIESEIEDSLCRVENYLTRPRCCGENGAILREVVKAFVSSAANRLFNQASQDQARAFVLSRIANSHIIIVLAGEQTDGKQQ